MAKEKSTPKRRSVIDLQSDEERAEVKKFSDAFQLEAVKPADIELPPMLLLVWGSEKSGKTHLLSTMSAVMPVYILDTELRAEYVQKKFENVRVARCRNFIEMFLSVKGIINKYPKGMVVFDSGTDLHKFAQERSQEELGVERIFPVTTWDYVYFKERALLNALKDAGFHVGITARAKDEYVKNEKSGNKIPNCFNELPYKADLVILCKEDKTKIVQKNGWGLTTDVEFKITDTLPVIIDKMKELA